ncbi:MAG: subfamily polymerase sigma factor, polymerase sigma-70 factor, subfamily [Candidatus Nomurabacteria bacterium]|nr:subfamily polymerase sigma factor, polymerase sigma-70 factor, subfamily [Candidatus Nomurabacteria bacterium]
MLQDTGQLSDEAIVIECKKDSEYFALLVDRYVPKLTRYIRRRSLATSDDIEDLLQNIFIKVYRNLNDYDTTLLFSSWIYRIAHNEMIDWYRREKRRATLSLDDDAQDIVTKLMSDDDLTTRFSNEEQKKYIINTLNGLDEKYKEILLLRFFEEKSYEEIADILKIPAGTVAVRINRAKKQLQKKIADYGTNI